MEHEFSFKGQRPGEVVSTIVKNHPFILFWPGIKAIFFLLLGASTMIYFPGQVSGLVLVICVLVAFGIFSRSIYDYTQSVLVITNQRLICVDQQGFLKRKIIETELDKIQDASSTTAGLFKMMLKFGHLTIRTAGASKGEEIVVRNIPKPYDIQQKIAALNHKAS